MPQFPKSAGQFALPQECVRGLLVIPSHQSSMLTVLLFTELVDGFNLPFVDHRYG